MTTLRLLLIGVIVCSAGCNDTDPDAEPIVVDTPATTVPEVTTPPVEFNPELDERLRGIVRPVAQSRFDDARAEATAYLDEHPDDPRGLFLLGLAHHKAKQYADARPRFERALELASDYHDVHHFLGWCRYNLGDMNGARRAFADHIAAVPGESDSHFGLALVDIEDGRLDNAEASLLRAMELIDELEATNPARFAARRGDLLKCHVRLADVHLAREMFEPAIDELLAAIDLDPNIESVYYKMSVAYRRLGRDDMADRALVERDRVRSSTGGGDG